MGITGDEKAEDLVISRITVINPDPDPAFIPQKYRSLFHGESFLRYGRHLFRFPITNMGYKRLASSFQSEFMGRLGIDFGACGIEEI